MISRGYIKITSQRGIASIIVVFIITILISLVSLGFARLMDRALRDVSSKQLGVAADYAAQSGLNDTIGFVKKNPGASVTDCADVSNSSTALGSYISSTAGGPKITTDGNTEYTCVLIDPEPGDILFQDLPPYNSQVIKLLPNSGTLEKLLFSWQAPASAGGNTKNPISSGGNGLDTEFAWGQQNNYPPLLRITLYPITTDDEVPKPANIRTFFLYPNQGSGTVGAGGYGSASTSGAFMSGNCNAAGDTSPINTAGFAGSADFQCNTVIDNLPQTINGLSVGYFYVRLTPLYLASDVSIKGNATGGGSAEFRGAQSVVDVTGKSGEAVRRIQARVSTAGEGGIIAGNHSIPEDAAVSAGTICKRLIVPSDPALSDYVIVDPTSVANSPACGAYIQVTTPPPTVTLAASPKSVGIGGSSNLTWTVNSIGPTTCTASNDGGLSSWDGSKSASGGTDPTGPLNSVRDYTFQLVCTNAGGSSAPASATVTVTSTPPPPPPVEICGNGIDDDGDGLIDEGCGGGGGGGDGCSSGGGGGSDPPNPCARGIIFGAWVGDNTAQFQVWGSHCYSGADINGQGVGWAAVPDDNGSWMTVTVSFPNSGGTATYTCNGNGTSSISTDVPPNGGGGGGGGGGGCTDPPGCPPTCGGDSCVPPQPGPDIVIASECRFGRIYLGYDVWVYDGVVNYWQGTGALCD